MDATKLRNSCICGNTLPYLECCGPYADAALGGASAAARSGDPAPAGPSGTPAGEAVYRSYRHGLHELSMALFPLRALYQAYWEKLGKEEYPHDLLMEDPDYGRVVLENFFWDHFQQYSDARPILRTARELESRDLRLSHDLMQWSYAPLWLYRVEERTPEEALLRNLGNGKQHRVTLAAGREDARRIPLAGAGLLTRLLPFRGREYCSHSLLAFPAGLSLSHLESLLREGCRELGIRPGVNLRPDVHCEEWRRHGSILLGLWRGTCYDAVVGRPRRSAAGRAEAPALFHYPQDRSALVQALAAAPGVSQAGPGTWDVRFRGLRLARLESKAGNLSVTLGDPSYRDFMKSWLRDHLAGALPPPAPVKDAAAREAATGIGSTGVAGLLPIPPGREESSVLDAWIHSPQEALNGQTPVQASNHDWGRRRLYLLLKDMLKQGRDVTALRRQLGL